MNEYIDLLTALFERQFSEAYLSITAKKRTQILPFIPTIFRRWYYSALAESTPLTPANITASVCAAHGHPSDTCPVVSSHSRAKWSGINVGVFDYSVKNHQVVNDLRTLLNYCSPSINLIEENYLSSNQELNIAENLSLRDPHYASFLLEVAIRMRLIEKIPSIYANIAQVSKDANERLAAAPEALFEEIVEAAITHSAFKLSSMVPLPEPVFTEQFIRGLLKEPMMTDDIFECVYDTLGFSLEDLFDEELQEEFEDFDASIITGTFLTGVALDKYFFTPFSYYLKLIRPIYVLPFDFQQELKFFYEAINEPDEISAQFYAPCSNYLFTELGLKFFNIEATPENYADASSFLPFESLKSYLFDNPEIMDKLPIWAHQELPEGFPFLPVSGKVLMFKIKLADEATFWINLEIQEEATLHRLYLEVLRYFYFDRNDDYSFFLGKTENPFTEYSAMRRSKRTRNISDIPLSELDFEFNRTMLLVLRNQGDEGHCLTFKLILELLDEKPKEPRTLYPVLVKMSKDLKKLHEDELESSIPPFLL